MCRNSLSVAVVVATLAASLASGAVAQSYDQTRLTNALRDRARAEARQAQSLEKMERLDRDRARSQDRARHNAEVTSRSARRFD